MAALALFAIACPLPLAAQERGPDRGGRETSLDDLIPESAVENPDDWAQRGATEPLQREADEAPPPAQEESQPVIQPVEVSPDLAEADDGELAAEDTGAAIDPATPLSPAPEIVLDWPDEQELPRFTPLDPEAGIRFAEAETQAPAGSEERLSDELVLIFPANPDEFPIRREFVRRFDELSTIVRLNSDEDDFARVSARAEEDEQLLLRLLRIYGYYNAQVYRTVQANPATQGAKPGQPRANFEIIPGNQYNFGAIDLGSLSDTGADFPTFRESFGIRTGDPLLQDRIVDQQAALANTMGESGYPFVEFSSPRLLVDHDRAEGDLTLRVTPGGKYVFGTVTSNLPDYLPGSHLGHIARFDTGQTYSQSDELDLRRAILATGLVGSVGITPVEATPPSGDTPGVVDMQVIMTKAPQRTLAGAIGYGTGEGFRLEGSWEHRNLFPPEGMLRVRGIAGTKEQLAGVTFRRNNLGGRDKVLTLDAYATHQERDAFEASTASLVGTYEQVSTILFQKPWSWSIGLELIATSEREAPVDGVQQPENTYFIAAAPMKILRDTSDSLLDPTRGFRVGGQVSPEISHINGGDTYLYVSTQFDLSYYRQMSESVVLAARTRVGSILGTDLENIAPSRRFYAGGGNSVRGYGYQAIGPRDTEGEPNGGRSLLELSLEARIKTGLMGGAVSLVPFIDAGSLSSQPYPEFEIFKVGAGVGLRYNTSFGPMRIDVATPLNPGPDDSRIGVYVSLGQAF